jgi:hypothetical protein
MAYHMERNKLHHMLTRHTKACQTQYTEAGHTQVLDKPKRWTRAHYAPMLPHRQLIHQYMAKDMRIARTLTVEERMFRKVRIRAIG